MIKVAKKIDDAALRGRLIFDINTLSIAPTDEIFIVACNLFLDKWGELCKMDGVGPEVFETVKHFKDQWLQERLRYWYSGASRGHVLNNSGLEGLNGVLKEELTQHRQMLLLEFLRKCLVFFHNESMRRDPEAVNFVGVDLIEPKLDRSIQETAFRLIRKPNHFQHVTMLNDGKTHTDVFVCLHHKSTKVPNDLLAVNAASRLLTRAWADFDRFSKDFSDV